MIKYSRQREAIKTYLLTHRTHPTAETVYTDLKNEFPNISLGTVYRNLSLLADRGEIQKIHIDNCADRFDGDISPHYHVICRNCGRVDDIPLENLDFINQLADYHYEGTVSGHSIYFYGRCPKCADDDASRQSCQQTIMTAKDQARRGLCQKRIMIADDDASRRDGSCHSLEMDPRGRIRRKAAFGGLRRRRKKRLKFF